MPRLAWAIVLLALAFAAVINLRDVAIRHPERLPWTPLSLDTPIGPFTGRKLALLTTDAPRCRQLLGEGGIPFTPLPPVTGRTCGYADGVTLRPAGPAIRWQPGLAVACPVAAALAIWERQIVQPSALRHFGTRVGSIEHYGSFACRRIAGRSGWSEHATADAVDIAGFRLRSGKHLRVKAGWQGKAPDQAFLREVRDGACQLFATVLSPDYNPAHADHLHFDQAARGMAGGSYCR